MEQTITLMLLLIGIAAWLKLQLSYRRHRAHLPPEHKEQSSNELTEELRIW